MNYGGYMTKQIVGDPQKAQEILDYLKENIAAISDGRVECNQMIGMAMIGSFNALMAIEVITSEEYGDLKQEVKRVLGIKNEDIAALEIFLM